MSQKTIAIFGAGSGLGTSVARRFGREGYRVALVARRPDPLDELVAALAQDGIEAAAFPADLSDRAAAVALLDRIRKRFGRIDVLLYAPVSATVGFRAARELDAATLQPLLDLYTLTPVDVIHALLPELLERGDGAILVGHGSSAAHPMPELSGIGLAMAATRNYLYSLHGELADKGVFVGTITIGALIARSAGERAMADDIAALPEGVAFPVVDPDDLADGLWTQVAERTTVELFFPPELAPAR